MSLTLPRLPPTQPGWDAFQIWWQQVVEAIESQETSQDAVIASIEALLQSVIDLNDLITTQGVDLAAVEAATLAAQAAADSANAAATALEEQTALAGSYPDGATITATDAGANVTVSIAAHTRRYTLADGTTTPVAVNAGSVPGLAYSTSYWIYYDDAARAGGAVTYQATTTPDTGAQIGDRHAVGAVTTPAAAAPPELGRVLNAPGVVQL